MRIKTITSQNCPSEEHDRKVNDFLEKLEAENRKVIRVIPDATEILNSTKLITTIIYDGPTIS